MPEASKIGEAFDVFAHPRISSPILENVWRQAYGIDYAAEARPNAFYPRSVLDGIVDSVGNFARGSQTLEIGCGHGLAGRYLARRLQVERHCGIDISRESIDLAESLANEDSSTDRAQSSFWVADAVSTGLEDASCNLVVCLDVLLYLPDRAAAMNEIHRLLAPGGCFAFTTWEQEGGHNARVGAEQVTDYRPLLMEAGLIVLEYREVDGWRGSQARVFRAIIEAEGELTRELGEDIAGMWTNMAKGGQREIAGRRYVFGLAQRPM